MLFLKEGFLGGLYLNDVQGQHGVVLFGRHSVFFPFSVELILLNFLSYADDLPIGDSIEYLALEDHFVSVLRLLHRTISWT